MSAGRFPSDRILYARGFPYGAPLCMVRGGALRREAVKAYVRDCAGFRWNGERHAYERYLDGAAFAAVLRDLRDLFGCDVQPKAGLDAAYVLNLDDAAMTATRREA